MTEGRDERTTGTPDITIHDPDDAIGAVAAGGSGERATGTPNTIYNLSSVLFHALEGGASYDTYIEDAEREGDEELTEFFRLAREEDRDRAAEARMLLAERASIASSIQEGVTSGASARPEPYTDPPGMEVVGEGAPSEDVRRDNIVAQMRDEDLTPPEEAVPPDDPGPSDAPKTERVPPRTTEGAPPRPEPSADFPGTEPITQDLSPREEEVPPPPEEIPPERAGEIPTAEEVPSGGEVPSEGFADPTTAERDARRRVER